MSQGPAYAAFTRPCLVIPVLTLDRLRSRRWSAKQPFAQPKSFRNVATVMCGHPKFT
jgi:hypothetical protein